MKTRVRLIATASLIAFGGVAMAADHLFTAQEHGLNGNTQSQAVAHAGEAPGRGSPFTFGAPDDAGIRRRSAYGAAQRGYPCLRRHDQRQQRDNPSPLSQPQSRQRSNS